MRVLLPLVAAVAAAATEHGEILSVLGPDRLSIQYYQLPVIVRLAEVDVPAATADQARAVLATAVGRVSNVAWAPDLGADDAGTPRVYVSLGTEPRSLNEQLVEGGLARSALLGQGGRNRDRLAAAEAKARRARSGVWAEAASSAPTAAAKGAFCAEVDGRYFYPSDAPEAARLNPKRVVSYASEAAARKAGKQPWQPAAPTATASTLEEARAACARGRKLCEEAAGSAPSDGRDALYQRAFLELSAAMQVFSRLAEAKPDDAKLGDELRECSQLRYAAMKSKRFH